MAFEFCCFISYPHGQDNVLVPFVNDFVDGLSKEIYAQTRKKIWIDYKFLKGGDRINEEIGPNICKSACMIALYTPLYFDAEHTYCAREFRAMELLEQERMVYLVEKGHGLIITVILRGAKRFPKVLESSRKYYKFDDIELNDPVDKIQVRYAQEIKEIAEYIIDRCESLDEVEAEIKHDCDGFCLPSEEEARTYIKTVLKKKIQPTPDPYPGGAHLATVTTEGGEK